MGHADFRVRGKIFASLGYPDAQWGMVRLTPEQQETFVRAEPKVYVPARGAWGAAGATTVRLAAATKTSARRALDLAWHNIAAAPPASARKKTRRKSTRA